MNNVAFLQILRAMEKDYDDRDEDCMIRSEIHVELRWFLHQLIGRIEKEMRDES